MNVLTYVTIVCVCLVVCKSLERIGALPDDEYLHRFENDARLFGRFSRGTLPFKSECIVGPGESKFPTNVSEENSESM